MGDVLRGLGVRPGRDRARRQRYRRSRRRRADGRVLVRRRRRRERGRSIRRSSAFARRSRQSSAERVDACRDAFLAILGGERSPRADVVALNAALVLYTAGKRTDLTVGTRSCARGSRFRRGRSATLRACKGVCIAWLRRRSQEDLRGQSRMLVEERWRASRTTIVRERAAASVADAATLSRALRSARRRRSSRRSSARRRRPV